MPTAKPSAKDATPDPQPDETPAASPARTPEPVAPPGPEPGVYEYTHSADCVYPHVPLTCRAARPERQATDTDPGEPATAATVFDWPFGPPDDGRWTKTKKKPNQAADNAPAAPSSEE